MPLGMGERSEKVPFRPLKCGLWPLRAKLRTEKIFLKQTSRQIMEHRDIEERDLARLYCVGKLSQEESLQFEAHFVDCPACLERLELLRSFRNGLKQATVEDAAIAWSLKAWSLKAWSLTGWSLTGLIAWLAALRAWKRAALLAGAACLVIVLPASLSFWKIIRLRQQL